MRDHIIICGLGHIGFRTFDLLRRANQKIIIISDKTNADWRSQIEEVGCIFLEGDARNDKLLLKANIQEAKCILALTDQDMVNISIVMDARKLNPSIKIISRMFDTDLGAHIASTFDVHQVFSTSELAAPLFLSSIHDKSALGQFSVNNTTYVVSEKNINTTDTSTFLLIKSQSDALVAAPISTLTTLPTTKFRKFFMRIMNNIRYFRSPVLENFRRFLGMLFCVIIFSTIYIEWRMNLRLIDALYFVITTVTTVGYGDFNFSHSPTDLKLFGCLLMLTGAASLAMLFSSITEIILSRKLQNLFGSRLVPKGEHVIVVGASNLSERVMMSLIAEEISVVVIEDDTTGHYSVDLKRQLAVVDGDPRSHNVLNRAAVKTATAIIAITEDDVENLGISLAAKKINPDIFTVTQIFDFSLASKLQDDVSIDRVLSMSNIAAPYFAAAVFGEQILLAIKWKENLIFLSHEKEVLEGKHEHLDGYLNHDIQIISIPLTQKPVS